MMEDLSYLDRRLYLVNSQTEFEAKLTSCEEFMTSSALHNNSDGFGETSLRVAAIVQWNPSFEVPDTFIGE